MSITTVTSLLNFKQKLSAIYRTCRKMSLPRPIFLMSIKNLKRLFVKNMGQLITAPEAIACLTLAIKFKEECRGPIDRIVSKTKLSKSEVHGAEYYVF
jgi:hypothetical protein